MNIIEISNNFCINYLAIIKKVAIELKLTQSQALCLNAIPFNGISQADLAKKLSIDISTLSRNLNKLILQNLIFKESSVLDKRAYKISITEEGQELLRDFNYILHNKLRSAYDKIDLISQDQLEEILNKLNWELELINK